MKLKLRIFVIGFLLIATNISSQSLSIFSEKMNNIVYVGVDNPISIFVTEDSIVSVKGIGCTIDKIDGSLYNLKVEKVGITKVVIKGKRYTSEKQFRVKCIPDPKPILFQELDKKVTVDNFVKTHGVIMSLENFDFDVRCRATHYTILRIPQNEKRESVTVNESSYTDEAKKLIRKAAKGDIYLFDEIKCNCTGDKVDRNLGVSLVVNIE